MKKTILGLLLLGITSLIADNTVKSFDLQKNGSMGGLLDTEDIIFLYQNQDTAGKSSVDLTVLKRISQVKICEVPEQRKIIEDLKMNVKYIYLSKDTKKMIVVKIDNCAGVPLKKTN